MNGTGILTWFDRNSSFRNLGIILSDLRFHNTFQFVKYGASAWFFPVFGTERSQRAFTSKFLIICSCKIKVRQLQRVVFHHKKKDILNFFLASTIWTYLKISFSLKLISKETLFAQKFGSHLVNADWLLTRQVKQTLDYVNKGAVDTLGARGFSCAVSGFVSSACGQRNEAPRRTRGKTSGTQGRQLMAC